MSIADRFIGGGAALLARLPAGRAPGLSIVIFHRVTPEPDPLFPGEMDAARFNRLMALVARAFTVLPLERALALREAGQLPRRALAITFDDGYADNAEVALPILQRHGLVASFFVAAGFLDGGRMWNDSVIEIVRCSRLERADFTAFGLAPLPLRTLEQRRHAIDALVMKFKYLSLAQRQQGLAELHRLLGAPALPEHLMMRSEQVQQLHRAGMEIGGHTINHPILRVLPDAEAEREIAGGRERLQAIIGAPVNVFAYPNGKPDQDYDRRHVEIVRRLGFKAAVSTAPGVATLGDDRYELPRFTPWDRQPARWMGRLLHQRLRAPASARAQLSAAPQPG
jgi:peptidoglycan/xylan/chitin deacetylase (PgdA/CDA1 family)